MFNKFKLLSLFLVIAPFPLFLGSWTTTQSTSTLSTNNSWEHNTQYYQEAISKLASQLYFVSTKINGNSQADAKAYVEKQCSIFKTKTYAQWDLNNTDQTYIGNCFTNLKSLCNQLNIYITDSYEYESGGYLNLEKSLQSEIQGTSLSSSYNELVKKVDPLINPSIDQEQFWKFGQSNYYDDLAYGLDLAQLLKDVSFNDMSQSDVNIANARSVLKYAESQFNNKLTVKSTVDDFITKLVGASDNGSLNVGSNLTIDDYQQLFNFSYDLTSGASLHYYNPSIDFNDLSLNTTDDFQINTAKQTSFGTQVTNSITNYNAGDIYPGYSLKMQIMNIDYSSNSDNVGLTVKFGVLPTNYTDDSLTVWENNNSQYIKMELPISSTNIALRSYIASHNNYKGYVGNNIATQPNSNQIYFIDSASQRPLLSTILSKFNNDTSSFTSNDVLNNPITLTSDDLTGIPLSNVLNSVNNETEDLFTSYHNKDEVKVFCTGFDSNTNTDSDLYLLLRIGVWDQTANAIVAWIPWTINNKNIDGAIKVRYNMPKDYVASVNYATKIIQVYNDFSSAYQYIKKYDNDDSYVDKIETTLDTKKDFLIAETVLESVSIGLSIMYTALEVATFGASSIMLGLSTAIDITSASLIGVEWGFDKTLDGEFNVSKQIRTYSKPFETTWDNIGTIISSNKDNVINQNIDTASKLNSANNIIKAFNGDVNAPVFNSTIWDFISHIGSISDVQVDNTTKTNLTYSSTINNPSVDLYLNYLLSIWAINEIGPIENLCAEFTNANIEQSSISKVINTCQKYKVANTVSLLKDIGAIIYDYKTIREVATLVKDAKDASKVAMIAGSAIVPSVAISLGLIDVAMQITSYLADFE